MEADEKNTGLSGGASRTNASYWRGSRPSLSKKSWRREASSDGLSGESSPSHGADAGLRPSERLYLSEISDLERSIGLGRLCLYRKHRCRLNVPSGDVTSSGGHICVVLT